MPTDRIGHEYTERKNFFVTKIRNGFFQIKFKASADKGIPSKGFKSIEDAQRFIDFIRPDKLVLNVNSKV